nr:biotin--[acetyl-CoA-carboxylase] ligase [Nitrosovibrio tenuis]
MKPLTFSVLRLLSDSEFRSGETIAQGLGISRTSVSYALRGVQEAGVTVQKIHGRGYRLLDPVQWLDRDIILKHLGQEKADNFNLEVMDIIGSTNSFLLQRIPMELNSGDTRVHAVAAELQTNGRGRRGRQWHSGLGDGLTFSLLWQFQQGASFLSGLSLAVGVAMIRALESSEIKGASLKWPNDVMFNFCKLAGILIELQGDMFGPTVAAIGIGINLKLPKSVQARIDQGATDVFSVTGELPDRNKLLAALLVNLAMALREFERGGLAPFMEEWERYHIFKNKPATLRLPDGTTQEGVVDSVANDGSLLLRTASGIQRYSTGEITLRRTT